MVKCYLFYYSSSTHNFYNTVLLVYRYIMAYIRRLDCWENEKNDEMMLCMMRRADILGAMRKIIV